MAGDRITELRIEGLRSIEKLTLPMRGLTVLIGDNGSGKSALVEACELLRRASTEGFFNDFHQIHGGLFSLLRHGASELRLGVCIEGDGPPLRYELALAKAGAFTTISDELLELGPTPDEPEGRVLVDRRRKEPKGRLPVPAFFHAEQSMLTTTKMPAPRAPERARMRTALANIEVHVPFEVTAPWIAAAHGQKSEARGEMQLQRVDRLERLGKNLPNVYYALQNEFGATHWNETMDYVRLGLGYEVENISLRAGSSGGTHSLWLKMQGRDEQIPASAISDGMLAYLAFVALYRLPRPDRSLLVFDEPDLHLHPELLGRVIGYFESIAEEQPVLLTTHSDRLLDGLEKPAESVRVCELEQPGAKTRLRTLDANALTSWLDDYRGLGDVRSAGHLRHVIAEPGEEPS